MKKVLPAVLIFTMLFLAAPAFSGAQTYAQAPVYTPVPTQAPAQSATPAAGAATAAPTAAATAAAPSNSTAPASNTAPSTSASCSNPYTVQAGDTLTSIAQQCGVDYSALLSANPGITNPDQIFPGQAVAIPAAAASSPGIPSTGGTNGQTYTVVSGDWLSSIAQRFNTTVQSIVNVNPWIGNPNLIFPGWVLTLPSGSSTPGIPATGGTGTSGQTYTVAPGDTLSSIAQRFNTSEAALMSANTWISNPNLIVPGWVLNIP